MNMNVPRTKILPIQGGGGRYDRQTVDTSTIEWAISSYCFLRAFICSSVWSHGPQISLNNDGLESDIRIFKGVHFLHVGLYDNSWDKH